MFIIPDIIQDESDVGDVSQASDAIMRGRSMDSIPSTFTNGSSSPGPNSKYSEPKQQFQLHDTFFLFFLITKLLFVEVHY